MQIWKPILNPKLTFEIWDTIWKGEKLSRHQNPEGWTNFLYGFSRLSYSCCWERRSSLVGMQLLSSAAEKSLSTGRAGWGRGWKEVSWKIWYFLIREFPRSLKERSGIHWHSKTQNLNTWWNPWLAKPAWLNGHCWEKTRWKKIETLKQLEGLFIKFCRCFPAGINKMSSCSGNSSSSWFFNIALCYSFISSSFRATCK